jgi:hypothetical protein
MNSWIFSNRTLLQLSYKWLVHYTIWKETPMKDECVKWISYQVSNSICTGWSKSLCAPDDYSTKNSVYSNNPHTIDDLKMAITEYIQNVDCAFLNMVFENTVRRVNKCLETGKWTLWTSLVTFCIVIIRCTETVHQQLLYLLLQLLQLRRLMIHSLLVLQHTCHQLKRLKKNRRGPQRPWISSWRECANEIPLWI